MKRRSLSLTTFFLKISKRNLCAHREKSPSVLHEVGPFPLLPKPPGYIALQVISVSGNDRVSEVRKNESLNWAEKPQTTMERGQGF